MPRDITELVIRETPTLRRDDAIRDAVRELLAANLPALPVVDDDGHFAGVFGEREFMEALFPGYVGTLQGAGFVTKSIEALLEKRAGCALETVGQHMNKEHVEVGPDSADMQIGEVFLHHRVLIVPVVADGRVVGVVTRSDFFRGLAEKLLDESDGAGAG